MDTHYYTPKDLVKRLRVDRSTVTRWIQRGVLPPPFKVGNVVRWPASTIDRWCLENVSRKLAEGE